MNKSAPLLLVCLLGACATQVQDSASLQRIETIVVIYAENHSFDNLYGLFPGANGVRNATEDQKTQLDHDGKPLPHLPPVYTGGKPDSKYPPEAR